MISERMVNDETTTQRTHRSLPSSIPTSRRRKEGWCCFELTCLGMSFSSNKHLVCVCSRVFSCPFTRATLSPASLVCGFGRWGRLLRRSTHVGGTAGAFQRKEKKLAVAGSLQSQVDPRTKTLETQRARKNALASIMRLLCCRKGGNRARAGCSLKHGDERGKDGPVFEHSSFQTFPCGHSSLAS